MSLTRARAIVVSALLLIIPLALHSLLANLSRDNLLERLKAADIHADDRALIEANKAHLSTEQLRSILDFLTDAPVFADSQHFDITVYNDWAEYNFQRPAGDALLTNLARRDLFLDPARQLNNPEITNMSAEALAALAFSQAYVEEKWDHTVPWDGEGNAVFNWIQPELLTPPQWEDYLAGDFLYRERVRYWFATFQPERLRRRDVADNREGDDIQAALSQIVAPVPNAPRLAGYSYPIGNQLYLQTAETLLWYSDYLEVSLERYGFAPSLALDTNIEIPQNASALLAQAPPPDWAYGEYDGLWALLQASFAQALREELSHPESAAFWNVMRFVHAGARQREGGGSPERPGDNQPAIMALRYAERSAEPRGRVPADISAFALITTVYSDSILLDFSNWDPAGAALIVPPLDDSRSDGIHRRLSERNKAILVIEQMGDERAYPHATHVAGSLGLGLRLVTQYEDPTGDFLPYTPEEAYFMARALSVEAREYGIEASRVTLCGSPLLRAGYAAYVEGNGMENEMDAVCG